MCGFSHLILRAVPQCGFLFRWANIDNDICIWFRTMIKASYTFKSCSLWLHLDQKNTKGRPEITGAAFLSRWNQRLELPPQASQHIRKCIKQYYHRWIFSRFSTHSKRLIISALHFRSSSKWNARGQKRSLYTVKQKGNRKWFRQPRQAERYETKA